MKAFRTRDSFSPSRKREGRLPQRAATVRPAALQTH